MKSWTAAKDIGPIQASKFNKAWSLAGCAFNAYSEGDHIIHIIGIGSGRGEDETAALSAVGECFAWTLDRKNIGAATEALEEVRAVRMANCPPESHAPCGCNGTVAHKKKDHKAQYVAPVKEAA